MDTFNTRRQALLPDIERACAEVAGLRSGWGRNVTFALLSREDARQNEPIVNSWMVLAQKAALGAHTLICEDGPVVRKEQSAHAEKGGEILEGRCAHGCTSVQESRISGRAEGHSRTTNP
jgi:hypothetical protein